MPTRGELFEAANERHKECTRTKDMAGLLEVIESYNQLLNDTPEEKVLIFTLATAYMQVGCNGLAIQLLKRAISYDRSIPDFWNNLGSAWRSEHNIEEARACYLKCASLKESPAVLNNLATLYINEGNPAAGLQYARRGLELDPQNEQCKWNLSLLLLELGQWREGLELYEAGLKTGDRQTRFYSNDPAAVPYWDGTPTGKRVVIYGEQGLGDEIMYASALREAAKALGGNVIYECHPRLEKVMRRSFPELTIYPTRKDNELEWPKADPPDLKCAIGTLFKLYRSEGIFPRESYLRPDWDKVQEYREWLKAAGPGPYIGIGWFGGSKRTRIDQRNFKLTQLLPLLKQDATFVSLQYTAGAKEKCDRFLENTGIRIHHWPEVVQEFDYDETVALIAALDLIIVPNTTAVHVAGAVGTLCWTLTPDKCAWRYSPAASKYYTAMYGPWVEQCRQLGDWEPQIERMADRLASFIKEENDIAAALIAEESK